MGPVCKSEEERLFRCPLIVPHSTLLSLSLSSLSFLDPIVPAVQSRTIKYSIVHVVRFANGHYKLVQGYFFDNFNVLKSIFHFSVGLLLDFAYFRLLVGLCSS